jgi:sugar lactone lactonase YvrE
MPGMNACPRRVRRAVDAWLSLYLLALLLAGCAPGTSPPGRPDAIWGRRGLSQGRLQKPRAMTIDAQDQLYIVDMTGRIQVFDADGNYLRGWRTPEILHGRPTGLSFDRQGRLLVADTHYFRVLSYTPAGELLDELTIGGTFGHEPGQFGFVTDCVQDARGNYYVSEYGEFDRIQKFSPQRRFVMQWGGHGTDPGQFMRPQSLDLDSSGRLWVADSCNHRIQVFDVDGDQARLVKVWGRPGREPGMLDYPWALVLDSEDRVYVVERGNHRVQKFDSDGRSLGAWGTSGRRPGELNEPWALVRDSRQRVHVLDTYNHRVQRLRL